MLPTAKDRWFLAVLLVGLTAGTILSGPTRSTDHFMPPPERGNFEEPPAPAHGYGKYRQLLAVLHCPEDTSTYQRYHDFGFCESCDWRKYRNIPAGHWVYVYPRWYVWRDSLVPAVAADPRPWNIAAPVITK
jgi:hypothetical protein